MADNNSKIPLITFSEDHYEPTKKVEPIDGYTSLGHVLFGMMPGHLFLNVHGDDGFTCLNDLVIEDNDKHMGLRHLYVGDLDVSELDSSEMKNISMYCHVFKYLADQNAILRDAFFPLGNLRGKFYTKNSNN